MLRFSPLVFLCLILSILYFPFALSAPTAPSLYLAKRQDGSPVTIITVDTIQGSTGPETQTCNITLTPITVDGQARFRQEKSCIQSPSSSNNNNTPTTTVESSSSSIDTQSSSTGSSTSSQTAASTTSTSDATSTSSSAASTESTSSSETSGVAPTDIQVIGASTTSALPTETPTSTDTSSSSVTSTTSTATSSATDSAGAVTPTNVSVMGSSAMPESSASAAASSIAAASTASAAAAFAIPGKQIQVLPIGLGVFAGVSVIALIVVGLVTYERTKYRRKFRKDKLAENAAPMGFGGMAERR